MTFARLVCVPLLLAAACSSSAPPRATTPSQPAAPPAAPAPATTPSLAEVEAALLGAEAWRADVTVRAVGRFTADLTATVTATRDQRVRFEARGKLDGKPVDLVWTTDGTRTSTGTPAPAHTTEAVALGLLRMGALHNVAALAWGSPAPDHADGGAATWIVTSEERELAPGTLGFRLEVDGEHAADAIVEVARGAAGPVLTKRTINVRFDTEEMTVEESYRFDLAHRPAPGDFVSAN